jgi:hypothetical protein
MTEESSGMTDQQYGPVEQLDVTGTLDPRSRISVSPARAHTPELPRYVLRLGGHTATVTLWAERAELVRLRDEIDAAIAETDETETGDPEM